MARRHRWASRSRQNSAVRCTSLSSFVTSVRRPSDKDLPASRAAIRERNTDYHSRLGIGAAGVGRCLPRSGSYSRRALCGCRAGYRSLSTNDHAPSRGNPWHLPRAPPRTACARVERPCKPGSYLIVAQVISCVPPWVDGPLNLVERHLGGALAACFPASREQRQWPQTLEMPVIRRLAAILAAAVAGCSRLMGVDSRLYAATSAARIAANLRSTRSLAKRRPQPRRGRKDHRLTGAVYPQ